MANVSDVTIWLALYFVLMVPCAYVGLGGPRLAYLGTQTAITYNPYGSTVFVVKPASAKDAPGCAASGASAVAAANSLRKTMRASSST